MKQIPIFGAIAVCLAFDEIVLYLLDDPFPVLNRNQRLERSINMVLFISMASFAPTAFCRGSRSLSMTSTWTSLRISRAIAWKNQFARIPSPRQLPPDISGVGAGHIALYCTCHRLRSPLATKKVKYSGGTFSGSRQKTPVGLWKINKLFARLFVPRPDSQLCCRRNGRSWVQPVRQFSGWRRFKLGERVA